MIAGSLRVLGRRTVLGLAIGLGLAVDGWAQDQPDTEQAEIGDSESNRDAPTSVDEITVTGVQSGVTDIQAESQAITAFSMEELDRSNIVNVDQLAFNVPALHVGQQGSNSIITLRGISTENASPTGEAGVQFHVDGVNYGRPAAARVAFFDLDGLQVMRGPQGTRGGKNATAGWINVITRKPSAEFETTADFQVGSYNQRRIRGSVNIPINEYVQTRFAFLTEDRDGFQRNLILRDEDRDAMDSDEFGFRGHMRLLPTESLDVLLTYNFFEANGVGAQAEVVGLEPHAPCNPFPVFIGGTGYDPLTNFPAFGGCAADPRTTDFQTGRPRTPTYAATGFDLERLPQYRFFENPATLGEPRHIATGASVQPHRIYIDEVPSQKNLFWGWTGTVGWQPPSLSFFGDTEVKSITSFQVINPSGFVDADATDLVLFSGNSDRNTDQWSQEFQWTGSSLEGRLDWLGSLFYMREATDSSGKFRIVLQGPQTVKIDQTTTNKSYGASLATTYHASETFSVKLGGRYIKDVKRNSILRANPPGSDAAFNASLGVCDGGAVDVEGRILRNAQGDPVIDPNTGEPKQLGDQYPDDGVPECKLSFRQLVGDLTLDWFPREENHFYFSVGNGFKGGGFALGESGSRNDTGTSLDTYLPEKIWAFLLGSKNTFFDDRLTLNLEGYFYNYRDQQIVLVDGLSTRTDNADSEMLGLDIEFDAEPFPGFRLDGNFATMDTEFTRYDAVDPLDVIVSSACRFDASTLVPNGRSTTPPCRLTSYEGNELARAPKLSYTLGAEYDIFLGRYGSLTPRVQYYWQDDTWFRPFNRTPENSGPNSLCPVEAPQGGCQLRDGTWYQLNAATGRDLQEAYHYTDIRLTWRSPSTNWTVEGFVQNLEDTVVYQNLLVSTPLLASPQMAWYGHPRLWGVRVGFRY